MDSTTLSAVGSFVSIAASVLLALAFAWVVWSTESLHVLVRRLWLLVNGNQEIADPQVRSFVDEQTSLVSFRLFSGVKVANLQDAHRLMHWTRLNGVQMRTLRFCGEYFDPALRQVRVQKLPGRAWQFAMLAACAIAGVLAIVSMLGLYADRPVLSLKATGRPFLASGTDVQAFRPPWSLDVAPLRVADCAAPAGANAARTSFTEQEVALLCGVLKDEGAPDFVKGALKKQRWALVMSAALAAWFSWLGLASWASITAARKLAGRKLDPALSGSQLSFDWRD